MVATFPRRLTTVSNHCAKRRQEASHARQKLLHMYSFATFEQVNDQERLLEATTRSRGGAGVGALKARKTARAPVLMAGAWVRAHSIGRT
jgi:hypothetical protein